MYNEDIMERFLNPRYAGVLRGANGVGVAKEVNTKETVRLYIDVNEDAVITNAKFKAFGSPVVIALADALSQMVIGMSIVEAQELNEARLMNMFEEIPQERIYAVFLSIDALNEAIDDYAKRLKRLQEKLLKENKLQENKQNDVKEELQNNESNIEQNAMFNIDDYYD